MGSGEEPLEEAPQEAQREILTQFSDLFSGKTVTRVGFRLLKDQEENEMKRLTYFASFAP